MLTLGACALAGQAQALQLGQLSLRSWQGEALAARVELYGIDPVTAHGLELELKPDSGGRATRADYDLLQRIEASVLLDDAGQPFVALRSSAPLTPAVVSFRLRATSGRLTVIQRYTLDIVAPPRLAALPAAVRRRAEAAPVEVTPVLPVTAVAAPQAGAPGIYGPVAPGQSLWKIMADQGLLGSDANASMARVVAANPHAFVGGDAGRLKVGALLDLGAALGAAPATPTQEPAAIAPATTTVATDTAALRPAAATAVATTATVVQAADATPTAVLPADGIDAETRARLDALSVKFAAIKARYDEQRKLATSTPTPATSAPAQAAPSGAAEPAPAAVPTVGGKSSSADAPLKKKAPVQPAPVKVAADAPDAESALSSLPWLPLAAGALIVIGLAVGGWRYTHGHRRRRAHAVATQADLDLRQQITAKAEKRLKLEDEVMRTLRGRGARGDADALAEESAQPGFEEIETRIAYGQYAEAETLLLEVLERAPDNHRAKLRLAEVYYLDERHDQFVALADELHHEHRADLDDDEWQRVMRMGRIIAPDQPPFSGPQIASLRDVG